MTNSYYEGGFTKKRSLADRSQSIRFFALALQLLPDEKICIDLTLPLVEVAATLWNILSV